MRRFLLLAVGSAILAGCASSSQEMMARERFGAYQHALSEYQKTEKSYLDHLTSMERYPEDPWLIEQRKIKERELEQERMLVQQARDELDQAIRDWNDHLGELRSAQKAAGHTDPKVFRDALRPRDSLSAPPLPVQTP